MTSADAARRLLRALALPALLLAALELWMRTRGAGSDALAAPSAALQAGWGALRDGSLWQATAFTLGSAFAGLALGGGLGLLVGTLLGLSRRAAAVAFLSVELLRPVPSVALIPHRDAGVRLRAAHGGGGGGLCHAVAGAGAGAGRGAAGGTAAAGGERRAAADPLAAGTLDRAAGHAAAAVRGAAAGRGHRAGGGGDGGDRGQPARHGLRA
jgi:hypothetical protein